MRRQAIAYLGDGTHKHWRAQTLVCTNTGARRLRQTWALGTPSIISGPSDAEPSIDRRQLRSITVKGGVQQPAGCEEAPLMDDIDNGINGPE